MTTCRDVIITSLWQSFKGHIALLGVIIQINSGTTFSFFRSRSLTFWGQENKFFSEEFKCSVGLSDKGIQNIVSQVGLFCLYC